jgi:hypothetical protein
MNWYKLAAINPWSIFEDIEFDGQGENRITRSMTINGDRLESFVSDVSEGALEMTNIYEYDGRLVIHYKISSSLANSSISTTIRNQRMLNGRVDIVSALHGMNVFGAIYSQDDALFHEGHAVIELEFYGEAKVI